MDKLALEEREAGQRFLQTLRRNHRDGEHEKSPGEAVPSVGAVHSAANGNNGSGVAPVSARTSSSTTTTTVKDKRSSLRATLEHLIVRYLRRITSSGEDEEDEENGGYEASSVRYRRQVADFNGTTTEVENATEVVGGNEGPDSSVEITLLTNDSDSSANGSAGFGTSDSSEITEAPGATGGGSSALSVESVNGGSFVGSTTAALSVDGKSSKLVDDGGERRPAGGVGGKGGTRKHKAKKKQECTSIRKRIAQLDRFELEKSMRNDSFREYNIRSALNYRYVSFVVNL